MPFLLNVLFELSTGLWLLACLALGIGYAALLYKKKSELSTSHVRLLFIVRTLAVAGIAFLLFAPLIKITTKSKERPIIIIGQDNSASIVNAKAPNFNTDNYLRALRRLQSQLGKEFEVKFYKFGSEVEQNRSLSFGDKVTNISSFFKRINNEYQNRNVGAIILSTDGIYTQGGNPQLDAAIIKSPIYTVALGDTIPKKDIFISNVRYNDIVYLNNQFQLEIDVEGYLSKGSISKLTVSDRSGVITSKAVRVTSDDFQSSVPLVLNADKKGTQRYQIDLSPVSGELSKVNNSKTIFVEIIDGRKEIVILANSPHPDLTALKQGIEENRNYEVKVLMADQAKSSDLTTSSLLILHQLPSAKTVASQIPKEVSKKPVLYILGAQTDFLAFSTSQNTLGLTSSGSLQESLGIVRSDFYAFNLTQSARSRIQRFAPLLAPFGTYAVKAPSTVLLSQKIGNVETEMPMLIFSKDKERKVGILAGEGIWRWRLNDFEDNGDHSAFDELVSKVVQYLSTTEDKRKFRVFSSKNNYEENEPVVFNAELYNDNYELINSPEVNITLKSKQGKSYSFLFSRINDSYELNAGILPAGEYTYQANTSLGKQKYSLSGNFVVLQQQAELVQTTANHQLLYSISKESAGRMLYPHQLKDLVKLIKEDELVKVIIHEDKRYEELIDVKYVFFILLLLLSAEWFSRKRHGEI